MPFSTLGYKQVMTVASDIYLVLIMYQVLFQTPYPYTFVNYWNSLLLMIVLVPLIGHRGTDTSYKVAWLARQQAEIWTLVSWPQSPWSRPSEDISKCLVPASTYWHPVLFCECRIQTVTHVTNWVLGAEGGLIAWTALRRQKGTFENGSIVKLWKFLL